MILFALPPSRIAQWWFAVEPYARQMERRFPDDWPIAETRRQASSAALVLWLVWDAELQEHFGAVGSQIVVKPSGRKLLSISWAAGREHGKWARMAADTLEAYGRAEGCEASIIEGRSGWGRALEGYQPKRWSILVKEL